MNSLGLRIRELDGQLASFERTDTSKYAVWDGHKFTKNRDMLVSLHMKPKQKYLILEILKQVTRAMMSTLNYVFYGRRVLKDSREINVILSKLQDDAHSILTDISSMVHNATIAGDPHVIEKLERFAGDLKEIEKRIGQSTGKLIEMKATYEAIGKINNEPIDVDKLTSIKGPIEGTIDEVKNAEANIRSFLESMKKTGNVVIENKLQPLPEEIWITRSCRRGVDDPVRQGEHSPITIDPNAPPPPPPPPTLPSVFSSAGKKDNCMNGKVLSKTSTGGLDLKSVKLKKATSMEKQLVSNTGSGQHGVSDTLLKNFKFKKAQSQEHIQPKSSGNPLGNPFTFINGRKQLKPQQVSEQTTEFRKLTDSDFRLNDPLLKKGKTINIYGTSIETEILQKNTTFIERSRKLNPLNPDEEDPNANWADE